MSHSLERPDSTHTHDRQAQVDSTSSITSDSDQRVDRSRVGHLLRAGLGWLPSLLVFTSLLLIAWYGHNNAWRLPTTASQDAKSDGGLSWCDSHGVPEDECIVCQSGLIEESPELAFCGEHGVHGCVLCDPSLAETKQRVEPTPGDLQRAARALALRPRKENLSIGNALGTRIQFASIAAMNKAGVDVEPIERRRVVETIAAAGEIRYDATKSAQVSPQADGIVRRVFVAVGAWVKQGQVLATIDSSEAGRLKTELLASLADERLRQANVARVRPLAGQAIAGKLLLEKENDLKQASALVDRLSRALNNLSVPIDPARLRELDTTEAETYVRRLGLAGVSTSLLPEQERNMNLIAVTAPLDGRIVTRTATLGQVVERGNELFRVVDTHTVWLDLRVAAEEAPLVKLKQTVHFLTDGQHQTRTGIVIWISSDVDPQTRTVRVRAELANADQNLRNESFGQGEIVLRDEADAIVVPESALQWDGWGQVVFVRDARFFEADRPKFFVTRSVRTGVDEDGFIEVIAGLLPGEVVASSGSDVLRSQLLRSKLGAGCTCGQ